MHLDDNDSAYSETWAQRRVSFRNYLHVFGGEVPALDNSEIQRCVSGHFEWSELLIQVFLCSHTRSYKQWSPLWVFFISWHLQRVTARSPPVARDTGARASIPVSAAGWTLWDTMREDVLAFSDVRLKAALLKQDKWMIRNVNSDMNMIEYIAYTPTPEINCFFL